jgi:purine-nucleoside phosphorylase
MKNEISKINLIAEFLQERLGDAPDVAVVLGSGLNDADFGMETPQSLGFSDIPQWPGSTVQGHSGLIKKGSIAGIDVLLQAGRVHLYEGYTAAEVVRPVRALIRWGVKRIIFTNAAGGINEYLKPGMMMFIEDHLNLTGQNPLAGANDESLGVRFPDMSKAYSRGLRALMVEEASRQGIVFKIGTYAGLLGPSYETPAEVKMLRTLGADAVGMSTVLEVIAAVHMGADVAGIATISNMAATYDSNAITHDEVQESGGRIIENLTRLIVAVAGKLKAEQ